MGEVAKVSLCLHDTVLLAVTLTTATLTLVTGLGEVSANLFAHDVLSCVRLKVWGKRKGD